MNIVSLSGGKDSCATALIMYENNIPIDLLVNSDLGRWEFPQVRDAVHKVSDIVGAKLISLKPVDFDWWMNERIVLKKDKTYMIGAGWPSRQHGRWCTREKFKVFDKLMQTIEDPVKFVGFASDEEHRTKSKEFIRRIEKGEKFRFPLIEYGLTEEDALKKCYDYGIDWGGLYEIFRSSNGRTPRLSCWCCPHQPLDSLRILRKEFPEYWNEMIRMGKETSQKVFKGWVKNGTDMTIDSLELKFSKEDNN